MRRVETRAGRPPARGARRIANSDRYVVLICSHISLEMLSRTCRARPRARSGRRRRASSDCPRRTRGSGARRARRGSGAILASAVRAPVPSSGVQKSIVAASRIARVELEVRGDVDHADRRRSPARRSGSSRTCSRRRDTAAAITSGDPTSASTQVSLPPPPCDELTTSEPRRSATRVSPPGVTFTSRPNSTNGRRSTWRPFEVVVHPARMPRERQRRLRDVAARIRPGCAAGTPRARLAWRAARSACRSRRSR